MLAAVEVPTGIGGHTPAGRVTDLPGQHTWASYRT